MGCNLSSKIQIIDNSHKNYEQYDLNTTRSNASSKHTYIDKLKSK